MTYYNDPENAEAYVKIADGYDGAELIEQLRKHLPDGASVLELGMGPGTDFELLSAHYTVTGSDYAQPFIDRYQKIDPAADLLQLDAITLDTDRRFDAIYSNKVLYHLTRDELRRSMLRQHELLNEGGLAAHAFWTGEGEESNHGLQFTYYDEASLQEQIGENFEVVLTMRYAEMEADDSLFVIWRKR